jgi:hypothetical protein
MNYKEICNEGNIGNRRRTSFTLVQSSAGAAPGQNRHRARTIARTDGEESSPTKNHRSPLMPVGQWRDTSRQSYRDSYRGDDSTYPVAHRCAAEIVDPLNALIRF